MKILILGATLTFGLAAALSEKYDVQILEVPDLTINDPAILRQELAPKVPVNNPYYPTSNFERVNAIERAPPLVIYAAYRTPDLGFGLFNVLHIQS